MQIAIGLYPGFTSLDAIGPYQVFTNIPDAEVILCADAATVDDDVGLLHLRIDASFDEVTTPDVIVLPGGTVTRRFIRDGHPVVDWVRRVHEHTRWTTSVCTGSLILGAAGVLDGLDATTHWCAYRALEGLGARPTERRVVVAGKVITAAGVSAGIDMALTVAAMVADPETAQAIQLGIEYDPQPPFDAGSPSKASPAVRERVEALMASSETAVLAE